MRSVITCAKSTSSYLYQNSGILLYATIIFIKFFFNKKLIKKNNNNFFFKKNLNYITSYFSQNEIFNFKECNFDTFFSNSFIWNYFKIGKILKISGLTIGKGTAGTIKKHKFSRGPVTHGSKHLRLQGSLGSGTTPGRTLPGKRMSGHLGFKNFYTTKGKIVLINPKENLIFVKGSLPGKDNSLLHIHE